MKNKNEKICLNYAYFTLLPAFFLVVNQCIIYQAKMNYSVSNFEDNLLGCFKFVSLSNEICQMRSSRTPHKFLYEGAAES